MYALAVAGDEKRREFLEQCLVNNAKRIQDLRNELPNEQPTD
jgi:hypothetical protein